MAGKLLTLWLFCCSSAGLFAQADSSKVQLREVEVAASRLRFSTGSRTSSADSLMLALQRHASLTHLLKQLSPIYIKNYGPANLATLSVRGTTANQTALVWNGIQINNPTTGLSDLNLLSINSVQHVALVHGPQSALYGSGAVGGTLFLNNVSPNANEPEIELFQQFGSFSSRSTQARVSFGNQKWRTRSGYHYSSSANNFPFTNTFLVGKPTQRTAHSHFAQHNINQDLLFYPSKKVSISVHGWYSTAAREIAPVMSATISEAEQFDKALRIVGVLQRQTSIGTSTIRLGHLDDYLLYLNPQIYAKTPDPARTHTWLVEAEHTVRIKKLQVNIGGSSRQINGNVTEYGKRIGVSQHALFLSLRQQIGNYTTIGVSARKELVTGFDPEPTFSLGLERQILQSKQLTIKAQVANSFRVPTLNERFWQPGGNPNLKPEKGLSAEAGVQWQSGLVNQVLEKAEITVYTSKVQDMIVWKPISAFTYSPVNLEQVWARGAELSVQSRLKLVPEYKASAGIRGAYAYSESTLESTSAKELQGKQLVYVPLHAGSAFVFIETKWLNVGWQQTWNGDVFTSSDNRQELPAYSLTDVLLWSPAVKVGFMTFSLSGQARNIFNTTYQTVRNIPMPGRNYEISIRMLLPISKPISTHE